jgi:hypothetical protein
MTDGQDGRTVAAERGEGGAGDDFMTDYLLGFKN